MRKKTLLICFTGLDGSGKTTHAKCLMNYLNQNGYPCIYVWGALRPIFSYFLFALARLVGFWKVKKKNAYNNPLENAPASIARVLAILLRLLYFIDFQIKTLFNIRLPLMLGKNVVCDRYFYDLLMELERSNLLSKKFSILISNTLPHPTVTFLLDAPERLIMERRGFSYEESKSKRRIFFNLCKIFNFITIYSSKDFSENQTIIRNVTLAYINHKCAKG